MLTKKEWGYMLSLIAINVIVIFSIVHTWYVDTHEDVTDLVATKILRPVDLTPHIVWAGQFVPDKAVYYVVGGRFGAGVCIEASST